MLNSKHTFAAELGGEPPPPQTFYLFARVFRQQRSVRANTAALANGRVTRSFPPGAPTRSRYPYASRTTLARFSLRRRRRVDQRLFTRKRYRTDRRRRVIIPSRHLSTTVNRTVTVPSPYRHRNVRCAFSSKKLHSSPYDLVFSSNRFLNFLFVIGMYFFFFITIFKLSPKS